MVGPRPLTPKHFNFYTPEAQEIVKQLKPGLTGVGGYQDHLWRVAGNAGGVEEVTSDESRITPPGPS
ncbi:MAG: hypothetical protein NTV01_15535 [Bacteroidia bacterium]|nr:hypothetical protein [Bacteroidia bacterium]